MELIIIGIGTVIIVIVLVAMLGFGRAVPPPVERPPARLTESDRVDDEEGWQSLALGPISGYATTRQGGRVVGYAPIRRLHLLPGWEAGQKGMRPYTWKARAEFERRKREGGMIG